MNRARYSLNQGKGLIEIPLGSDNVDTLMRGDELSVDVGGKIPNGVENGSRLEESYQVKIKFDRGPMSRPEARREKNRIDLRLPELIKTHVYLKGEGSNAFHKIMVHPPSKEVSYVRLFRKDHKTT